MIRSRTVNTIHELSAQGKSIQDIAISLGIARNTVRKYLRHPELCAMPHPRPNRRSKLDPFKEQVKQWLGGATIATTVRPCCRVCWTWATQEA